METRKIHQPRRGRRLARNAALACVALTLAAPAMAQVFQWKDADGRTIFSDAPPPGGKAKQVSKGGGIEEQKTAPVPKEGEKKAGVTKSGADEKANRAADEKREQALREYCDSAKARLGELQSGVRIVAIDAKGERYVMTDEHRAAESAKLRQGMLDTKCP